MGLLDLFKKQKKESTDTKLIVCLKNQEVYENFVALFVVDFKPYDTQQIGIWEATNQPVLIREEVDGHWSSHFFLLNNLSFEEVRNYAQKSADVVSVSARYFLDIDETNWKTLFHRALGEEKREQKLKQRYSFLTGEDIRYNVKKG